MSFLHFLLPGGSHGLHLLVNQVVLSQNGGLVEEVLHHFKEARILKYESQKFSQNPDFSPKLTAAWGIF